MHGSLEGDEKLGVAPVFTGPTYEEAEPKMEAGKEETLEKGVSHKLRAVLRMMTRHRAKGVYFLSTHLTPHQDGHLRTGWCLIQLCPPPTVGTSYKRIKEIIRTNIY